MSIKAAVQKAVTLFESFREAAPRRIGVVKMAIPKAVAVMGYVEGIDYRTTHGGKVTLYHHDFEPGSRPLLAVSANGRQLLLLGGRYEFTERGIVDKDARGRDIDNPKHGRNINPKRDPGRMTQSQAFAQIRALGLSVKKTGEGNEIRVTVKSGNPDTDEAVAYYTDDLEDAVSTAADIARRWASDPRNSATPHDPAHKKLVRQLSEHFASDEAADKSSRASNPGKNGRRVRSEYAANREMQRGARKPPTYHEHMERKARRKNPGKGYSTDRAGHVYFHDVAEAERHARRLLGRVVHYEKGWAVQKRKSGPYLTEAELP